MAIRILSTGSYAPEKILTNADLEDLVDTTDEWIVTRTGIKERHIARDDEATSDLALEAANRALESVGRTPEQLDLVVVATITPDKLFPATACVLQEKLGATNAVCFDITAACSGLIYALQTTTALMKSCPQYKTAMVIGAEKLSAITDWEDRSTCVLFGDGAGALVLEENGDDSQIDSVMSINLGSDGNYGSLLQVPAGGSAMPPTRETILEGMHFLKMEGQEVFKLAVKAMASSSRQVMEDAGVTPEDIKCVIPHQANLRIIKAVGKQLKISQDLVYANVDRFGNTSAASIGLALDELNRAGRLKKGDRIVLTAFGAGLTWGSALLDW
jgi:3-oxoacyl-[acyl-carrier-protein] synthase-3